MDGDENAPRSRLKRGLRLLLCLGLVFLVLSLAGYGAAAMRAGILGLMTVLAGCLNRRSDRGPPCVSPLCC